MAEFQFIAALVTAAIMIGGAAVILLRLIGKDQATLTDRQEMEDGTIILTFVLPKNRKKLGLKVGEQLNIQTMRHPKSKQFSPIQSGVGSFKILLVPSLQSNSDKDSSQIYKHLVQLKLKQKIKFKVVQTNIEYLGNSQIKIKKAGNKIFCKKFKNVYVLAQGNKISIAYQIVKGICEDQSQNKPQVTVLFVGGGITDFALKNQFEHLEDNYSNVSYFYSLPVRGQRQPSIAGMGISSEKVSESFSTNENETFCILCAEQIDLSVVVERALLNKKVPAQHIFKC